MNYGKLDTGLAAALADIQEGLKPSPLNIFIHATHPLGLGEAEFLESIGVNNQGSGQEIITATVSPNDLSELSEQPWVKYLKLSRTMRRLHSK